jgi:glycosyltransferase involved in cell wall biosynthesis
MRVLHLVSGNRWTGAASPAFYETVALREAKIDAIYAYVGGYNLQDRIGHLPWATPIIEKRQNPASFLRNANVIAEKVKREGIDLIHAHLSLDHSLALWVSRATSVPAVRTFHSHRGFRRNMLTRLMLRQTAAICVVNASFLTHPIIAPRQPALTPPPVDHRIFTPGSETARPLYGLGRDTTVVGVIGKISVGRGFEDAIHTFRIIRERKPGAKMMIVGKGAHRSALERLTLETGTAGDVIWTGYQDGGLVPHFRAMDVLLFTATGSDEGHRATTEAMACGTPVAAWPLPGIPELLGDLSTELVSEHSSHASLAARALELLDRRDGISERCAESTARFDLRRTAERISGVYHDVIESRRAVGTRP